RWATLGGSGGAQDDVIGGRGAGGAAGFVVARHRGDVARLGYRSFGRRHAWVWATLGRGGGAQDDIGGFVRSGVRGGGAEDDVSGGFVRSGVRGGGAQDDMGQALLGEDDAGGGVGQHPGDPLGGVLGVDGDVAGAGLE